MNKRTGRALGVVGIAAVLALQGLTPALATTSNDSCFISAIDSARASAGLGSLGVNLVLESVATLWAQSMATVQVLSHNLNLANLAPSNWTNLGENVGEGPSCSAIAAAFMGSPDHRANILDTSFSAVGVGVVMDGRGTMWVAEDFMGTGASPAPTTPPPAPKPVTPPPAPVHTTAPAPVHTTAPSPVHTTAPPPVHTIAVAPKTVTAPIPPAPTTPVAPPAVTPPPTPDPSPTSEAPQLAEPITVPTPAIPIVQAVVKTISITSVHGGHVAKPHHGLVHRIVSSIASFFSHLL